MTGITIILIAAFLYGALAGRCFGGWLGLSRTFRLALFLPAILPAMAVYPLHPDILFWPGAIPPVYGFIATGIIIALLFIHLSDGHRYDRPWKILLRYGWAPLLLAVLTETPVVAATGPVIALAAAACRMWEFPAVLLPWDRVGVKDSSGRILQEPSQMLDGWAAYWEMIKGGATMVAWVTPPLLAVVR